MNVRSDRRLTEESGWRIATWSLIGIGIVAVAWIAIAYTGEPDSVSIMWNGTVIETLHGPPFRTSYVPSIAGNGEIKGADIEAAVLRTDDWSGLRSGCYATYSGVLADQAAAEDRSDVVVRRGQALGEDTYARFTGAHT